MTDTQTAFVLVPRELAELIADGDRRYSDEWWNGLLNFRNLLSAAPKPPESEIGPVAWRRRLMNPVEDVGGYKAGTWGEWKACTLPQAEYAMLTGGVQHFSPPLRAEAEPLYPQARIDADAAIIAGLRAEVESAGSLRLRLNAYRDRAEAAEARVKELEDALGPFAASAEDIDANDDYSAASIWEHPCALDITIAHLRRARAALASKKETVDE